MAYYSAFDDRQKLLGDVACVTVWGWFIDWAERQGGELARLAVTGRSENLGQLARELRAVRSPGIGYKEIRIEELRRMFLGYAERAVRAVWITDEPLDVRQTGITGGPEVQRGDGEVGSARGGEP